VICLRTTIPQRFTSMASLVILLAVGCVQAQVDPCSDLRRLITETYTFKPSELSVAQQTTKSEAMDRVWDTVRARSSELLACLRAAMTDPNADNFFRFDGSNLLVSLDQSRESKLTLIHSYALVDLKEVNLRDWITNLSRLGVEGLDVSEPADKWLRYPKASYYLPEHGGYKVTKGDGALFLYGSMDEAQATPALLKILLDPNHPAREIALQVLMSQATPESVRALKSVDGAELSREMGSGLKAFLTKPQLFKPRVRPKTSRQQFVTAFEKLLAGDSGPFLDLVTEVPDGEKDVVAVLAPEDLPLVRKVRRLIISGGNPHSTEYYKSFTGILMSFVWKPELVN